MLETLTEFVPLSPKPVAREEAAAEHREETISEFVAFVTGRDERLLESRPLKKSAARSASPDEHKAFVRELLGESRSFAAPAKRQTSAGLREFLNRVGG